MQQQKTAHFKWSLWGKLWPFMKPYRGWAILSFLSVILAATSVLCMGQAIRGLIDQGFHQDNTVGFQHSILLLIGLVVLLAIASFMRSYTTSFLSEKTAMSLRRAVFAHVLRVSPSTFETTKVAEIQTHLTHDMALLQIIIGSTGTMALRNVLMVTGGILFLVTTSPYLTGLFLLVVPFVVVPLSIVGRRMRKISRRAQDHLANFSGYVDEMVSHLKLVQAYTYEKQASQVFDQKLNTFFQTTRKRLFYQSSLACLIILLVFSAVIGLLWHGGSLVVQGGLTAGTLVSFIFYAIIVASSIGSIGEFWGHVQHASGALERIMGVFQTPAHHPDQKLVLTKQQSAGRIDFQRISFRYPSRTHQWAVHEFQAIAEPGQKVAIIGPSGAGKSTLFHLLLRFYDPQEGNILLDGTNINHYDVHTLRQQMALVPQDPIIFSGTIIDNILYGMPEASNSMVNQAIKDAALDEFVSKLPQGYETLVGEKGVRLSGGQKQRIAIARALIRQPKILLLDEATSALDNYHENIIQQALDGLMTRCTTLIIAHRLSTVVNADQIWVMDKGALLAVGRHEELMSYSSFYSDMVESQFALHNKSDRLVQDNQG